MSATRMGPFETETEARAATQAAADPGLLPIKPPQNRRLLGRVCEAAGVAMGRYDDRILGWLSIWEPSMVVVVAGWVARAYEAGLTTAPDGGTVLSPAEADTVRQALAEAAAWRSMRAEGSPAEYAALRARLGGDRP